MRQLQLQSSEFHRLYWQAKSENNTSVMEAHRQVQAAVASGKPVSEAALQTVTSYFLSH